MAVIETGVNDFGIAAAGFCASRAVALNEERRGCRAGRELSCDRKTYNSGTDDLDFDDWQVR